MGNTGMCCLAKWPVTGGKGNHLMKNVIILTTGRTGSSVLAGLISRDRYYIDRESVQARFSYPKGDFENPELIRLNNQLLQAAGYDNPKRVRCSCNPVESVIASFKKMAVSERGDEYDSFVEKCSRFEPWLWKDPRLVFTIHFWKYLIDLEKIRFITITRDPYQIFRSFSKGGIAYTRKEVYEHVAYESRLIEMFLDAHGVRPLRLDYSEIWDRLILNRKLDEFLGISISEEDYNDIVKPVSVKQESAPLFQLRYCWGYLKLQVKRRLENPV